MNSLSILIPTYNGVCTELVTELHRQAEALTIDYEILVADDGSTNLAVKDANRTINQLSHCRYIERTENVGRAAIRNYLSAEGQYEWFLFIDSDMIVCRHDFLKQYMCTEDAPIIYGGIVIGSPIPANLRSMYEKKSEARHSFERRKQSPYQDFHTANFLIRRELMQRNPFDLRFRNYGYEDVLFGKCMEQQHIPIRHIDNPLSFEVFESNADFVSKTEEGLRTLHQFRHDLLGYSRLLDHASQPSIAAISPAIRLWHRLFGKVERLMLTGAHPSLAVFKLYKLGYFLSLK